MEKLIKAMIYLDTDEGEKMDMLIRDVHVSLFLLNSLWEKHGLHTINVETSEFDTLRRFWGLDTSVPTRWKNKDADKGDSSAPTSYYGKGVFEDADSKEEKEK